MAEREPASATVTTYGEANDRTREVLREMLTENTGTHMLDSGGAYGRHWQRNQGEDFEKHPEVRVEWGIWPEPEGRWAREHPDQRARIEMIVTLDLYHFLAERLEYDAERTAEFDKIAEEFPNEPWLGVADIWAERYAERHGVDEARTVNTYNYESHLSQVIQYTAVESDEGSELHLVALSIHGGCDVRGGYTRPRIFREWSYDLSDDQKFEVCCSQCEDRWGQRTRWEFDGPGGSYCEAGHPDLIEFPVMPYQPDGGFRFWRRLFGNDFGVPGVIIVDRDANRASCPVCGKGELEVWPPIAS